MIRKVLTIGQSSYAVTLPKDFIRQHRLAPGNDLQVAHEGSMLTVKTVGTGVHVKTDLAGINAEHLQETTHFVEQLLNGYFLAGAQQVTITNASTEIREAITDVLAKNNLQFYENNSDKQEIRISCPVDLTDDQALEHLVRRALQLLYICLEDSSKTPCTVHEHINLARRAVSQNLQTRKHLALYAFLEAIDVFAASMHDLETRPEYLSEYTKATYLLHQALTAQTLKPLCELLAHLRHLGDYVQRLEAHHQIHAKQLLACLQRASANIIIYQSPT